jgi:hypothetical protein
MWRAHLDRRPDFAAVFLLPLAVLVVDDVEVRRLLVSLILGLDGAQ